MRENRRPALLIGVVLLIAVVGTLLTFVSRVPTTPATLESQMSDPFDLPLESYLIDTTRYGVAWKSLLAECMDEESLDYPTDVIDLSEPAPNTSTRLGHLVMTEAKVRSFGYRESPDLRIVQQTEPEISPRSAEKYRIVLDRCIESSRTKLPSFVDPGNVILQLDGESRDAAETDSQVIAASDRWRHCMIRAGVHDGLDEEPDRPAGPRGYRIHVLSAMDAKHHPGTVDTMTLPPTPDEIAMALQDVECRDTSGYTREYLNAVRKAQVRLISENLNSVDRARSDMKEINLLVESRLRYIGP